MYSFNNKHHSKQPLAPHPIVCAVQMNSQQNIDNNLTVASRAIKQAVDNGASLIVLPENVASMGKQQQTAQRFDGLSAYFAKLAAEHQVHIVAGTLPCPYRPDGTKVANDKLRQVSLLFAPDGSQLARYDKIHLFKALVNDSHGSYDEGLTFEAGEQTVVAPIEINNQAYRLGMMVCFDLRFPALAQRYRQAGADIITAPAAFTYLTGQAHWQLLLQARALDSQCLLIGATQGGQHHYASNSTKETIRETWGHSTIVDATSNILATHNDCNIDSNTGYALVFAPFDKLQQNQIRAQLPIFNCHRLS